MNDNFFDNVFNNPSSKENADLASSDFLETAEACPLPFTNDIIEFAESEKFLGIKLFPKQKEILQQYYTYEDSNRKYNTLIIIAGMRSSKSSLSAIISLFETHKLLAHVNPQKYYGLLPGQRIYIVNIANARKQSSETIFASVDSIIRTNPWWRTYIAWLKSREKAELNIRSGDLFHKTEVSYEFRNKQVYIVSEQSNSASLAGRTIKLFLSDEISRTDVSEDEVQGKSQKRSAQAIFNTLSRATKTFKSEGLTVVVTSPMYEDDYGMQLLYRCGTLNIGENGKNHIMTLASRFKGERIATYLGFHYATYEMNPNITREDLVAERASSTESYRRDYEAIPPSSISPFIEHPFKVDECIVNKEPIAYFDDVEFVEEARDKFGKVLEAKTYIGKKLISIKPNRMNYYYICCDPGEKYDSFTLCMAHPEEITTEAYDRNGKVVPAKRLKTVIDLLLEWKPDKERGITVKFEDAEKVIAILAENLTIKKVTYDQWNSTRSLQTLFSQNIRGELLKISTPMYEIFRTRIYGRLIELPPNDALIDQIKKLQRIRQKVDHMPGTHKDLADVVARVDFLIHSYELETVLSGELLTPVGVSFAPGLGEKTSVVKTIYNRVTATSQRMGNGIWGGSSPLDNFFKGG